MLRRRLLKKKSSFRPDPEGNSQICSAAIANKFEEEAALLEQVSRAPCLAGGTPEEVAECRQARAKLRGLQASLPGQYAKCMEQQAYGRQRRFFKAKAQRAEIKTEIFSKRQERERAQLETAMQRQEYKLKKVELRKARREAGEGGTAIKVAGIAAVAAAALLL